MWPLGIWGAGGSAFSRRDGPRHHDRAVADYVSAHDGHMSTLTNPRRRLFFGHVTAAVHSWNVATVTEWAVATQHTTQHLRLYEYPTAVLLELLFRSGDSEKQAGQILLFDHLWINTPSSYSYSFFFGFTPIQRT